jgi:alkylhydroperoxidase/carboxymuconolactone decarboxylase family protein YurZ
MGMKEVYQRPGLDLKTRKMLTVAKVIVVGDAQPEMKVHIRCAYRPNRRCEDPPNQLKLLR